jgi:hypothetical protein
MSTRVPNVRHSSGTRAGNTRVRTPIRLKDTFHYGSFGQNRGHDENRCPDRLATTLPGGAFPFSRSPSFSKSNRNKHPLLQESNHHGINRDRNAERQMSGSDDDDHVPSGAGAGGNDRGASGVPAEKEREEDPGAEAADLHPASSRDSEEADDESYGNDDGMEEEEAEDDVIEEDDAAVARDDGDERIFSELDADFLMSFLLPAVRRAVDLWNAAVLLRMIALYGPTTIGNASAVQRLFVNVGPPSSASDPGPYFPGIFSFFVGELERCQRIVSIDLEHANFCYVGGLPWDAGAGGRPDRNESLDLRVDPALQPHADDLDRLFGSVLPNHPSLKYITIRESHIQLRCVQLLAESVIANPGFDLYMLAFENTPLTVECARLLSCMLHHNVRLAQLRLWHCGIGSEGLLLVCEGVGANEHIEGLNYRDDGVVPSGAVVPAVAPTSTLKYFIVKARSWSREAFAELVWALRVNVHLKDLYLGQDGEFPDAHLVHDLLRTYNFTLPTLCLDTTRLGPDMVASRPPAYQDRVPIGSLLRRNQRVRGVVDELEAADYRLPPRPLWPLALQEISTFPTLLYRFVRKGNLAEWALQLEDMVSLHDSTIGRDQLEQSDS